MNSYQTQSGTSQQPSPQSFLPPHSQPAMYSGMGMPLAANLGGPSSLDMNIGPPGNMAMMPSSMNFANMSSPMPNNMGSINPAYLAVLQNAQQNPNAINGMPGKLPSSYPSYQSQPQPHQPMLPPHSQMPNMVSSQMHAYQSSNHPMQSHGQSISPNQLMSASPSQLMSGPSSQSVQSQGHSLTLTPAQLLQQQQTGAINPASLGNPGSMTIGGMNPNFSGMGNMMTAVGAGNMNTQGMPNVGGGMNQALNANVHNMRPNVPSGMNPTRFAQMTPQERIAFQRQQQVASLGHGLPAERGPSGAAGQSGYERGPSLTHERPPSQQLHERASSQTHERQSSQQPHDRAQSQPRDIAALQNERSSSAASVRSHHSHQNMDAGPQHGLMGPLGSRPGTASGVMPQLTRMNTHQQHPMNTNPGMNVMHMSSGTANMNPTMATHMNPSVSLMPHMMQPQQMNAGTSMNSQMNHGMQMAQMGQVGVAGGMGMPMNRPPTRTGSALGPGSPKQSPPMNLNMGGSVLMGSTGNVGAGMGAAMGGVAGGSTMGGMNANVQATMSAGLGGGMGVGMGPDIAAAMGGGMAGIVGSVNAGMNMGMGVNTQGMSSTPTIPSMGGIGNMGAMNINQGGPAGLGMVGGGMMARPVIHSAVQRPEREHMLQPQVRERSASVQRETSLPPTSAGSFIGQGLDGASVQNLSSMHVNMPPAVASGARQSSQPPVVPHQQSPVRQPPPSHRSPMVAVGKINDMPAPSGPAPATGPPVHGAPPGQKLPPYLASLNPAVTQITYIPYDSPPKRAESADGAEDDKESDIDSSKPEGDDSKDAKQTVKIEDPVMKLTPAEISTLKEIRAQDAAYDAINRAKHNRMLQEMQTAGPASRLAWWDRDFSIQMGTNRRPDRFDVRYPRPPRTDGNVPRRKGARREGIRIPRRLPPELANRSEQLVPIRLEFDVEHHKMRDTFLWNLHDPVITPEMFAQTLVEDYALSPNYHSVIVKSIQEQLGDFKAHMVGMDWKPLSSTVDLDDSKIEELDEFVPVEKTSEETDGNVGQVMEDGDNNQVGGKGTLDAEAVRWWESWQKRCKKQVLCRSAVTNSRRKKRKVALDTPAPGASTVHNDKLQAGDADEKTMQEDLRILIKLDIIVGSLKLDDQFEWDLENQDASPEQFAELYAKELGLGGEFKTAIAHCIREQINVYQRSLVLVGYPSDGWMTQDEDLRIAFLPTLMAGARPMDQVQSYTPTLNYLSDGEIERSEKEREKELTKRRKRNTRGRRGIALPDREPNRTYRTPAVGFPELDPATLALAVAANAPTSRRAAAAAASLTIANMVASENGTPIMPLQLPPQQSTVTIPAVSGKEKKPKGLFKPPSYPPTILHPRARVNAPTPSTAVESKLMLPSSLLEDEPPPPVVNTAPPDLKAAAKRAREAEKEAKEKELAEGQHANVINGVWHCSNCGCPESIAIGRRKGPLGDKSQCGTCGKFWHRHRRLRPVQYNPDPEYHLSLRNETEQTKTSTKKRGRASNSAAVADSTEPPSRQKSEVEAPPAATVLPSEDDRPVSPVSSASSGSEAPLAQQFLKTNGASRPPPPSSRQATPDSPRPPSNAQLTSPGEPCSAVAAPQSNGKYILPPWLTSAMHDLQALYPDDRFEAILRKPAPKALPEWRIKCLDCPGKLYNPGPGDTLSNYEVHLKNRQHRLRVNNRIENMS